MRSAVGASSSIVIIMWSSLHSQPRRLLSNVAENKHCAHPIEWDPFIVTLQIGIFMVNRTINLSCFIYCSYRNFLYGGLQIPENLIAWYHVWYGYIYITFYLQTWKVVNIPSCYYAMSDQSVIDVDQITFYLQLAQLWMYRPRIQLIACLSIIISNWCLSYENW